MVNSTFSFATISARLRHGVGLFLTGSLWGLASLSQAACPTPQPPSGDGSSGSPYLIQNVENLYWLTQSGDGVNTGQIRELNTFVHIRQTADIDASSIDECDPGWTPPDLGGRYDGGDFKISNLKAYADGNSLALFDTIFSYGNDDAGVQNLTLENFRNGEDARDMAGFAVGLDGSQGSNQSYKFSNLKLASSSIQDSTGNATGVGGIVNQVFGTADNVVFDQVVISDTTLSHSQSTALMGGMAARVSSGLDSFKILNSRVKAKLLFDQGNNQTKVGGLVGELVEAADSMSATPPNLQIADTYASLSNDGSGLGYPFNLNNSTALITLLGSQSGRVNPQSGRPPVDFVNLEAENLYVEVPDGETGTDTDMAGTGLQVEKISASALTDQSTFTGFDFTSGPWRTNSAVDGGAPYLSWEFPDPQVTVDTSSVPAGAGIAVSPSDDPITVALGQTQSVDITVNDGYVIQIDDSASTCLGTLTGSTYQTQALTEDCTVKINAFTHGNAFDGSVEGAAPNSGDGNNDGVADADQIHVASVPLATDSGSVVYAALEATGERPLVEVSPNPIDTVNFASLPNLSEGAEAVLGMLEFKALQVTSGATETFTVTVHSEAALEGVLKWNSGTSQWDSIGTVSGQSVTFDITDGGPYDRDGAANGEILDPIVPLTAVPAAEDASDGSDSGDSGNGGSDNGDPGGDASNDETAQASEPPPAKPVPTTSSFMLVLLAALMLGLVFQQRAWRHTHQA